METEEFTEETVTKTPTISDVELNELISKVEFMLTQLKTVEIFVNKLHEMVDKGTFDNTKHGMSLLDIKFHLLIMYCSRLCVYISMRYIILNKTKYFFDSSSNPIIMIN